VPPIRPENGLTPALGGVYGVGTLDTFVEDAYKCLKSPVRLGLNLAELKISGFSDDTRDVGLVVTNIIVFPIKLSLFNILC
jgi:hypothetical protein